MVPLMLIQVFAFGFVTYLFLVWYGFKLRIPALDVKRDHNKKPAVILLSIILAGVEIALLRTPGQTWMIFLVTGLGLVAYFFMKPSIEKELEEKQRKNKEGEQPGPEETPK